MSKKFSKKIENAMAEAMAITEPQKAESTWERTGSEKGRDFSQCDDKGCWFCYPQNAEMPVGTVNFDTAEPVNPFKVIADWIRGNPVQNSMESHPSYPRKSVSWGDGEIPADIPTFELNANSFIQRDSLLARVLMGEIASQSESLEKMDSILRDAPVEVPKYALDDLVIISREELARLRNIENAYDEIVNIVKE